MPPRRREAIVDGDGNYGRYIVEDPKLVEDLAHHDFSSVSGFTYPDPVYLDADLCPEARTWLDIVWIWQETTPRELPGLHVHDFPEVVLLVGSDPQDVSGPRRAGLVGHGGGRRR